MKNFEILLKKLIRMKYDKDEDEPLQRPVLIRQNAMAYEELNELMNYIIQDELNRDDEELD